MSKDKYKRKEGQQKSRPRLIAAVDGESEANYLHAQFGAAYTVIVVEKAKALPTLVDAVAAALEKPSFQPSYGIVLSDIETPEDNRLQQLALMADQASAKEIAIYFNAPHFEATMLRHFRPVPFNMPKSEIERLLKAESEAVGLPYKKPESIAYHKDFALLQRQAQFKQHCAHTHQQTELPCVCQMLDDLQ